ncbi:MAG: PDZ domain-containing protein [Bacillota bacterium]
MDAIVDLIRSVIRSYPSMFSNIVVDILYLIVLVLVAGQYRKIQSVEKNLYGAAKNKALNNTVYAVGLGLIGGLLSSLLLVLVGVSVSDSGIGYLFPIAILLFLISPRLLCYSYAGGIAALCYLIFGWPEINVPSVMGLVACLHAAESFLIRISGHSCATPFYVSQKDGRVVGGFALQRFWPIPLLVLFLIPSVLVPNAQNMIVLPDWWPLIRPPEALDTEHMIFAMMPVIAALGYGDIAVAAKPKDKAKSTSKNLMVYSGLLLILSIAASRWSLFAWIAALFSPIGHEMVIRKGLKEEFENAPIYVPPEEGVMVLDVIHKSFAEEAGIRTGDVILSVNEWPVNSKADILQILRTSDEGYMVFRVRRGDEPHIIETVHVRKESGQPLGVIFVPEPGDQPMVTQQTDGIILALIKKLFRKPSKEPQDAAD